MIFLLGKVSRRASERLGAQRTPVGSCGSMSANQVRSTVVNICLVGYGSIARAHVQALAGEPVTLHTVMGRLAEPTAAFAAEFGFRRHTTDLDEALADPAIDAVLITSPTDLHAQQTEKALRAGKHALVEIPLATTLADVDALSALARENRRCLMVCHTQRYYPPLVEARRWVAENRLHVYHLCVR